MRDQTGNWVVLFLEIWNFFGPIKGQIFLLINDKKLIIFGVKISKKRFHC